ncbi:MAG: NUDIX hydrolase [Spirochaetales bacterium]|nr:NUDIX hydrolase [Spirochaetales bacterium]
MRFPYRGAGIALVSDGRILMGKRSVKPFLGSWCVPGGGREKGDKDDLATAVRELREETGIDFASSFPDASCICRWSLSLPFFSWRTYFFSVPPEKARQLALVPSEFSELEWVFISELRSNGKKRHLRPFSGAEVRFLVRQGRRSELSHFN